MCSAECSLPRAPCRRLLGHAGSRRSITDAPPGAGGSAGLPCPVRQPILSGTMRTPMFAVLLVFAATAAADVHQPPDVVVRETVQSLAALVADCRLPLAADPQALRGVVDKYLRPKADVLYAGQLILGRYWADADPDQRRRFAEALYGTLVSRYATGLLVLTAGSVVVVPPAETAEKDGHAAVEVRVQAGFATPVPAQLQ